MEGTRKRHSLSSDDESPVSKYRRLEIQECLQDNNELEWTVGSSRSLPSEADNDILDIITINSDSEDISS